MDVQQELISVDETAVITSRSRWALYRDIRAENFPPAVRFGRSIRVNRALLDEFMRTGGTPKKEPEAA